jgi:glycogen debranching enzyme
MLARLAHCRLPILLALAAIATAQTPLHSFATLPLTETGPVLRQPVLSGEPFTVAGLQGVLVGQQQGVLESWVLPYKLLSHLTLEADVAGYPVPIDLNAQARELEVRPDRTTITYSHIALTVRQIMLSPDSAPEGTGPVILFQVDALHPTDLVLRFTAELRPMWPAPGGNPPSPEWVAQGASGHYILHSDFPDLAAAIALPGATAGILAPYQERPQVHPLELHLHIDPHDTRLHPLLMAVGSTTASATNATLAATLAQLNDQLPALYTAHVARIRQQEQQLTSIHTPDPALDAALTWAETSITQLRARIPPTAALPRGEVGLVAGYYASGDSARPGFGWFFGRDALYTLYALNSYGDPTLARTELEFLLRRQRADGKIMHEYSQTAAMLQPPNTWASLPYEYAAADATPLFLTTLLDYIRTSGDTAFLTAHRDAVMKAWHFETTHDSDGDGIYDNAEGTGWVESWPPGMPHQEIYLALLDQQASTAMSQLAQLLNDTTTATAAQQRAATLHTTIEREYYRPATHTYAFSYNAPTVETANTIFPAIAWWNKQSSAPALDHPAASLRAWASHDFDTDWGLRDLAASDPLFDSMSYHQGSVWPLFTGWASLAEYRADQPLAGYQTLMQNAGLTTAQDPGAVTELLSGEFYEPFGRSTSHQLWSSAMVVTPLLRGLFGLDADALTHTLRIHPQLPADWPSATVNNLRVGASVVSLDLQRKGVWLNATLHTLSGPPVALQDATGHTVALPLDTGPPTMLTLHLPAVEVVVPHALPLRGARTSQPKVLNETRTANSYTLEVEAPADTTMTLHVIRNDPAAQVHSEGATLLNDDLHLHLPSGTGYTSQTITLRW